MTNYPPLAPKSVLTIDGDATRIELRPLRCADCPRMSEQDTVAFKQDGIAIEKGPSPLGLHLNSGTEIGLNLLRYIAAGEWHDEARRIEKKLCKDAGATAALCGNPCSFCPHNKYDEEFNQICPVKVTERKADVWEALKGGEEKP